MAHFTGLKELQNHPHKAGFDIGSKNLFTAKVGELKEIVAEHRKACFFTGVHAQRLQLRPFFEQLGITTAAIKIGDQMKSIHRKSPIRIK